MHPVSRLAEIVVALRMRSDEHCRNDRRGTSLAKLTKRHRDAEDKQRERTARWQERL